jgi:hypothetical protein
MHALSTSCKQKSTRALARVQFDVCFLLGGDYMDINRKIARLIVAAQISSDRGKYENAVDNGSHTGRNARRYGYGVKTINIVNAINLIRANKTQFNYWVVENPDQNGYPSIITFFEWKVGDQRYQISFHTPWRLAKDLIPYVGTGRPTRWNKIFGGSREAARQLKEFYNL